MTAKEHAQILLINVSGRDRPGITAGLAQILARHGATVLDIDQAVIQNNLAWGMLVSITSPLTADSLFKDLLFKAHELDMDIRLTPVDASEYAQWVDQGSRGKHIVTLIARQIDAGHIAEIAKLASRHGQNIEAIKRISGRAQVEASVLPARPMAVELILRGGNHDIGQLRADCLRLSQAIEVDIAVQRDDIFRRNRRLVCFDMDSTLIQDEAINLMATAAGVGDEVRSITERAMNGALDFKQSFTQRVALLAGLDQSYLDDIAQSLTITEGAERLIENLKRLGYRTAILSGGFTYFANRFQAELGIDYVHANELEIVDGKLTGKVLGEIVDEQRKAQAMRDIVAREGISLEQAIAVGDGANDIAMLSAAGLGIAFHAKPAVRAKADYAVANVGLDAILYLLGMREEEISH